MMIYVNKVQLLEKFFRNTGVSLTDLAIVLVTQSADNASVVLKDAQDDIEGQNNAAKIVASNADDGQ